jgi:type II secretory pathway pseudopilin PulG
MGIIILLAALVIPAMNTIKGAGDITKTASDLSDLIQQARAYAMGNNTYVYLGLKEVDQMAGGYTDGKGQIIAAIIASKTGQRPLSTPGSTTPTALSNDTNTITALSRLQRFDNTHLAGSVSEINTSGGMTNMATANTADLGATDATTTFQWPVGNPKTTFNKVIEIDPQGVARLQSASVTSLDQIQNWIEIPLQPSKGSAGVAANEKNAADLQIDGMTGNVQIFRP